MSNGASALVCGRSARNKTLSGDTQENAGMNANAISSTSGTAVLLLTKWRDCQIGRIESWLVEGQQTAGE